MIILTRQNRKTICVALALAGLMTTIVSGQINVEDEASEKTPFKLLWGFDTGG